MSSLPQEPPKVFVRRYKRGTRAPRVRIYTRQPLLVTHKDVAMFQSNIPESIGGTDIQLHDYYVAIQWMPREDELQNDVVQETLVLGFMALLQQRSGWPSVEREDFEFDRLQEIARREDRVIEWHFST